MTPSDEMRGLIERIDDRWVTVEADRALYVSRGVNTILCDRLPSPITLVLLNPSCAASLRALSTKGKIDG